MNRIEKYKRKKIEEREKRERREERRKSKIWSGKYNPNLMYEYGVKYGRIKKEKFCTYCGVLMDKDFCDFCGFNSKTEDDGEEKFRSRTIPKTVQREVWRRDMGRCVECGSKERLEFDHIIPFSKGGSNTARNIQLLCEKCNRSKSNKI